MSGTMENGGKKVDGKGSFQLAFDNQNMYMETAIKSLDTLNDQIVQFIFAPKSSQLDLENDLPEKERETLKSSMALMRGLLMDAQAKFRKMVEDNKQLASRIDCSISAANEEVNALRGELADTNRRLNQISEVAAGDECKMVIPDNDLAVMQRSNQDAEEITRLKEENAKLQDIVQSLRKEIENMRSSNKLAAASEESKINELKLDLIQTKQEVNRAREALQAMKADRKRLKAEKLDLLGQMKQLYCTLEDKEAELRDFIRNYEQRMKESDHSIKQLAIEKEESEREKWEILKRARDAAERSVAMRAELDLKEQQIKKLESKVAESQRKLQLMSSHSLSGDLFNRSLDIGKKSFSGEDLCTPNHNPPSPTDLPLSARSSASGMSSLANYTSQNGSLDTLGPIGESSRSSEEMNDGIYVQIAGNQTPVLTAAEKEARKKKRKSLTTFSKMFGKSRTRRSIAVSDPSILDEHPECPSPRLSCLTQDNYQEKLQVLSQAKSLPMCHWKATHVLAWLEIEMNMPMYGKICSENIKSGRVLLDLSDSELDSALALEGPLHRRKLRLAVEEYRDPSQCKYPKAALIDHTWIAHRWVKDLGLPQYSPVMERHLVDGRLLNALTRKDLEKYLGIHRKFHHASLLHAVELLRRINFDKEVLSQRRSQAEEENCDPLVWTNHRLIKWVRSIDLEEYADNLRESGVHGAVVVLEPTFNSEALATALGIPPSKSYVRRHLASELETLVRPARLVMSKRAAIEAHSSSSKKKPPKTPGGSLGRSFVRSYRGGPNSPVEDPESRGSFKRLGFRGSLGRALGKKAKQELDSTPQNSPKITVIHNHQGSHTPEVQPKIAEEEEVITSSTTV